MPHYDIVGLGNAIVDVLSLCEEEALARLSLRKGSMTLIDEAQAEKLYGEMGPSTECSGGSVANSLAGMASLGAKCAFMGKVKDDQLGGIFRHDMRATGVAFDTPAATEGLATARCLIFVTPDAQRTMNTFIGACAKVAESDIDERLAADGQVLYVEGYLWDQPAAKAAIRKAMGAAKAAGRKVAFTLSDTFCVERHRAEFLALAKKEVDILFANEQELMALHETLDFEKALSAAQGMCEVIAVTRGEKGAVVLSAKGREVVATERVAKVVDTTGAGDLFASGFLFGITRGWSYADAAALGNRCAGQIIQQMGARSPVPLAKLVA